MSVPVQPYQNLLDGTRHLFHHNLMSGYSKWHRKSYHFIAPATKEYTYQWLWDTAFHAIVLTHFNNEWAKNEIRSFLKVQRKDGFLPHIVFWGGGRFLPHWAYIESSLSFRPRQTSLTQPPMLPIAVERIYQKDYDHEFLLEVLPKLAAHHRWLLHFRDPDKDYLISIISPNESGMDESPAFQVVTGFYGHSTVKLHYSFRKADIMNHRFKYNNKVILEKDYFNVEDLMFNVVFIESARSLSRMFDVVDNRAEAVFFEGIAVKAEESLLYKCWNKEDKIFYPLYSGVEKQARVKTVACLMPLLLDGLKGEKLQALVREHLLNPNEFWTPYPVPSVAKSEPYYHPTDTPLHKVKLLWRGPTWINTNWFIIKGLKKHGYGEIANEITTKTLEMVEKSGFREYYNPETGEGYRRTDFGWSTLVVDF